MRYVLREILGYGSAGRAIAEPQLPAPAWRREYSARLFAKGCRGGPAGNRRRPVAARRNIPGPQMATEIGTRPGAPGASPVAAPHSASGGPAWPGGAGPGEESLYGQKSGLGGPVAPA